MRKRIKPITFWSLAVAGVGLSVWWMTWFPYEPLRLYTAIPETALFISEHDALSDRWESLVQNPVIQNMVAALDPESGDMRAGLKSKDTEFLVRRLAGRKAVLAHVPMYERTGASAWVMASWCGVSGQWLRWGLIPGLSAALTPEEYQYGRRGWVVVDPKSPDNYLSLAVIEGMLLACYSKDPMGVRHLVARVEGRASMARELGLRSGDVGPAMVAEAARYAEGLLSGHPFGLAPDRGWLATRKIHESLPLRGDLRVALTAVVPAEIAGWASLMPRNRIEAMPASQRAGPGGLEAGGDLDRLLGDIPAALWVGPYGRVHPMAFGGVGEKMWQAVGERLQELRMAEGPFFACVTRPAYSGRIFGIRAATLLMGLRVKDPEKALGSVVEIVDMANESGSIGLMGKAVETENGKLVELSGIDEGSLGRIPQNDRPCFTAFADWLVFCSNRFALEKIMAEWRARPASPVDPAWRREAAARTAESVLWLDVDSSYKAISNINGLFGLLLHAASFDGGDEIRQRLVMTKQALEVLRPMKSGCVWFEPSGSGLDMHFRSSR